MRRINNYRIFKETTEEMIAAGRFNPCLKITFVDRLGRHTHRLTSGYSDEIHAYRNADLTCVLSVNERLGNENKQNSTALSASNKGIHHREI
jgi:hypothetical protein